MPDMSGMVPAEEIPPTGTILHLQRLSTEDGPGIRTTVFFKGCPLHCTWCHNPESISPRPQVQWLENRCIGCQTCIQACPNHALQITSSGVVRDRQACQVCGECVQACPANAHEMLGQVVTVAALMAELVKDEAFYQKSGGGVTLSGGETALQARFAEALLVALKDAGIPAALDTCGLCALETLQQLAHGCDLILYDLKLINPAAHRRHTGGDNRRILENLLWLGQYVRQHPGMPLWVRTPLIPGATFEEENILGIGRWLAENLTGLVERWELCAFNNLCRDKYQRLEMDWQFAEKGLLTQAELDQARKWAERSGFNPDRIHVTGAAKSEFTEEERLNDR
jgi:pyruvate formate lyase activating enzyme